MKKHFDTLLLDLDGTLIDSRKDLSTAVNHVLKELGHKPQTLEQIVPKIGNGLRKLLTDSLGLTDKKILDQAKIIFDEQYLNHCVDETTVYSGVIETLEAVKNKLKCGIVTNKPEKYTEKILSTLGLKPYFQAVVGGDTLPFTKPQPEPLNEALKRLGSTATCALMVGDGIQDVLASKAATVDICLVEYGFGFHMELLTMSPTYIGKSFSEIKEIVL